MGQSLAISGVIGGSEDSVVAALRDYAKRHGGALELARLRLADAGCLAITTTTGGVAVLYPWDFYDWENVAPYLSKAVEKPVFSFYIHDSDLWMYLLYDGSEMVDRFNPVPSYWQDSDDDRCSWQGNAIEVARRVPGLAAERISAYLVEWNEEMYDVHGKKKAYPEDRFHFGHDWQLVDFMDKLGLGFPIDEKGAALGVTYRFECKT